MMLSTLDWVIILGYVVVTMGVGIAFSRRAGKSLEEFFVSGRSLPWWIACLLYTSDAADELT